LCLINALCWGFAERLPFVIAESSCSTNQCPGNKFQVTC